MTKKEKRKEDIILIPEEYLNPFNVLETQKGEEYFRKKNIKEKINRIENIINQKKWEQASD
jgi:hypothetical protein